MITPTRVLAAAASLAILASACGVAPVASSPPPPSVASAVATASAPASPALTGPAAVAVRYFDLVNRGDASGVATLFTDDAVFIGAAPCEVTTFCKGTAAIAKRVEAAAAGHSKLTLVGTPLVAGTLVFLRWEVRSDSIQRAGLERRLVVGNVVVLGDKIGVFAAQDDLSDAQTLKFGTAQQQAQASASPASSGAKTDPAAVVQRYIDALNRGDATAAAAVFADTAVNISGSCPSKAPCKTPADILKQIQTSIAGHWKVTLGDPLVAGNVVQFRPEVRNDAVTAAGVGSIRAFDTWTIAGDKVVGHIALFDLSDVQTLKFFQAQK